MIPEIIVIPIVTCVMIALLSNIITWILFKKISKIKPDIKRNKNILYGYWFIGVPIRINSSGEEYKKIIRYHNILATIFYISFWVAFAVTAVLFIISVFPNGLE
jgi:hypothetical protein